MYNPQCTVAKITELRKQKGISATELNKACQLNKNTIATSANSKTGLSAKTLVDISECLDCSTDYLLGREDSPYINTTISESEEMLNKLISVYSEMDIVQKSKLLVLADEILKGGEKNE